MQATPYERLRYRLGEAAAESLSRLAFGKDESPVVPEREPKSIGHEVTFAQDTADPNIIEATLLELCDKAARRLRKEALLAKVVTLKLRDAGFKTITRQTTLASPTDLEEIFFENVRSLFAQAKWAGKPLRLVGVSLSGLERKENEQGRLFVGKRMNYAVSTRRLTGSGTALARRRNPGRLLHRYGRKKRKKEEGGASYWCARPARSVTTSAR